MQDQAELRELRASGVQAEEIGRLGLKQYLFAGLKPWVSAHTRIETALPTGLAVRDHYDHENP